MVLALTFQSFPASASKLAATNPDLGAAEPYAVLAGTYIQSIGTLYTNRSLGISPGLGAPPHINTFAISHLPPYGVHDSDTEAANAQAANLDALNAVNGQPCDHNYGPITVNLAYAPPLSPGTYCADSFNLTGNLNLLGSGVWIFRSTTLTTGTGATITGGDACNVWWQVNGDANIGDTNTFTGNILARGNISLGNSTNLSGRAFSRDGSVTLNQNTIGVPVCAAPATPTFTPEPPTLTPSNTPEPPTSTPSNSPEPPTLTPSNTPDPGTSTPTPTDASTGTPTSTATRLPPIAGLPITGGGAPIRSGLPLGLVLAGSVGLGTVVIGTGRFIKTRRRK